MATNPYGGLTSMIGMMLRADQQEQLMEFRQEELDFRREEAQKNRDFESRRLGVYEARNQIDEDQLKINQQVQENNQKVAEMGFRNTEASKLIKKFIGVDVNGIPLIDQSTGRLNKEALLKGLEGRHPEVDGLALGTIQNAGIAKELQDLGFTPSEILPAGVLGPTRSEETTFKGDGANTPLGEITVTSTDLRPDTFSGVIPAKEGEQLYSVVGTYSDGTRAPLTVDGSTSGESNLVQFTYPQLVEMINLNWRSRVLDTNVGASFGANVRTANSVLTDRKGKVTSEEMADEVARNNVVGQIDTLTTAEAEAGNPAFRREFLSYISDPKLTDEERDELMLDLAVDLGLDVPSILTTEAPKNIVEVGGNQPASILGNATDPALQIGMQSAANPTGFGFAPFIDPDKSSTPVQKSIRQAKVKVDRLDNEIEKLRANPNKSAELTEKQIERNTLVYKTNGDNLLDIKEQIKNTEQSIAQDATGNTTDLEERLSGLRGKEDELLKAGVRTEEMESDAYKQLKEDLLGLENVSEQIQQKDQDLYETLTKQAEQRIAEGFVPSAPQKDALQRVLEGLDVKGSLDKAKSIPTVEQVLLRSILVAEARPEDKLALQETLDNLLQTGDPNLSSKELSDERVSIIGQISPIIGKVAEVNNSLARLEEIAQKRTEYEGDEQKRKLEAEGQVLGNAQKTQELIEAKRKFVDEEREFVGELRGKLDTFLIENRKQIKSNKKLDGATKDIADFFRNTRNRLRRYTSTLPDGSLYFTNVQAVQVIEDANNEALSVILGVLADQKGSLFSRGVELRLDDFDGNAIRFNKGENTFNFIGTDNEIQGGDIKLEDVRAVSTSLANALLVRADINAGQADILERQANR